MFFSSSENEGDSVTPEAQFVCQSETSAVSFIYRELRPDEWKTCVVLLGTLMCVSVVCG